MSDEIVSLADRARDRAAKSSQRDVMGSVNDFCTRKEAIDAAVVVGQTVYDHVSEEHGKAFAELERQVTARIRAEFASRTLRAKVRRWLAQLDQWWGRVAQRMRILDEDMPFLTMPVGGVQREDAAVPLPMIREFVEWGPDSDAWLAVGGVALGPDALNPGDACRRIRCPSTDVLRLYAEALGGDPSAIEDGQVSKAVTGEVLDDCRTLARGEVLKRADTKPELVT